MNHGSDSRQNTAERKKSRYQNEFNISSIGNDNESKIQKNAMHVFSWYKRRYLNYDNTVILVILHSCIALIIQHKHNSKVDNKAAKIMTSSSFKLPTIYE